jgi:hypothetical protein
MPGADSSSVLQPQPAGNKTFDNREGVTIRINEGYLVLWSITLESGCNDPDFSAAKPWWDWLIGTAHAHSESTPLQIGSPMVIDLTAEDLQAVGLGELTPPPDSYCGTTTQLISADADARGLPDSVDMVGKSLYIDGEYSTDDGLSWSPFLISTGISLLPAKRIFPLPLTLSRDEPNGSIDLSIAYQTWFDGVDMDHVDDPNHFNQVLYNISASIRAATQ